MKFLGDDQYSKLAFGGASISGNSGGYGFGDISREDAISLINYAHERGVRVFDSAPIYGFGESERRIGKALKDKREDSFIISKSGVTWHSNMRVDMTNDPAVTHKMLEQSLRDLDSDYIDLYMVHWPDKKVDIRKPIEVLAKAKLEGRIKHIGLCNSHEEDFSKASEVEKVECLQSELNFFQRQSIDTSMKIAREKNVAFMSWGTLDKGILTGRVNKQRSYDNSDCRSWAPWWKAIDKDERYKKMEVLLPLLKNNNLNGLDLALHYNLSHSEVSSILCGARTHEQLDQILDSLQREFPSGLLEELEESIS